MDVLQYQSISQWLKPRPKNSHKGDFGHVLVVGGDEGYPGAVRLAAEAALRVGAGLVSVATRPRYADLLNINRPELMPHAIHHAEDLEPLIAKSSVIVAGPGLGRSSWSRELCEMIFQSSQPLVLDADGLNWLADFPNRRKNWILTPHPGEAGRLLKKSAEIIQKNREETVQALSDTFDAVAVLKGAGTLVATTKGVARCEAGNPGMASGGMGDVLSGVIGGLFAQGLTAEKAAKMGVLIHAMAGDLAKKDGERGMLASDLMPYLRRLVNQGE